MIDTFDWEQYFIDKDLDYLFYFGKENAMTKKDKTEDQK